MPVIIGNPAIIEHSTYPLVASAWKVCYALPVTNELRKGGKMAEPGVRMRINKRVFEQYYKIALKDHGSQRKVAEAAGVTHTLIGHILRDRHKTHVNLQTAIGFESAFDAPKQVIFMPEVLPLTGNTAKAVA